MMNKHTRTQSGFSLLEMLLSTAVLAVLSIAILNVLQSYANRVAAKSESEYIKEIALSVQEILRNPEYYQAIYSQADLQSNDLIEIEVNDLVDGFMANGINIPPSNILNSRVRGDLTVVIKTSDVGANQALSMMITLKSPKEITRANKIATFLGEYGGIYNENNTDVVNVFGSWRFPIAEIQPSIISNIITANPPTSDRVYYFYYKHVPFDYLAGDYLYRTAIPGRPELNRMFTPLNMGGNNITGADDIAVNGDLNLSSGAMLNRPLNVQGDTVITNGDLIVGGTMNTNNVTIRGVGTGNRGNFIIQGAMNISDTATIRNELNASEANFLNGMATTGQLDVRTLISDGDIQSDRVFASTITTSDPSQRQNVNVTQQIGAGSLNTDAMIVRLGDVGAIDTLITNDAVFQGQLLTNDSEINDLNPVVFGACDNGC